MNARYDSECAAASCWTGTCSDRQRLLPKSARERRPNESNDNDLYNGGGANRFIAGRFNPDKCTFVVSPLEFTAADNLRIDDQYSGLNTAAARSDTLSGYAPGNQYNTRPLSWGPPPEGHPRAA